MMADVALTRNSLVPDDSFVLSKWDLRGENVISALSFFEDLERYGFDMYRVPSEVLNPPLGVREFSGGTR